MPPHPFNKFEAHWRLRKAAAVRGVLRELSAEDALRLRQALHAQLAELGA